MKHWPESFLSQSNDVGSLWAKSEKPRSCDFSAWCSWCVWTFQEMTESLGSRFLPISDTWQFKCEASTEVQLCWWSEMVPYLELRCVSGWYLGVYDYKITKLVISVACGWMNSIMPWNWWENRPDQLQPSLQVYLILISSYWYRKSIISPLLSMLPRFDICFIKPRFLTSSRASSEVVTQYLNQP